MDKLELSKTLSCNSRNITIGSLFVITFNKWVNLMCYMLRHYFSCFCGDCTTYQGMERAHELVSSLLQVES